MDSFWHWWIVSLTLISLIIFAVLLFAVWRNQPKPTTTKTTGHVYDGIEELDNPMPYWWCLLFVATFIFTAGYLILYPGLGYWKGLLGWTSIKELEQQQLQYERRFSQEFKRYLDMPIELLISNPKVMKMGQNIFLQNCAACHRIDGSGSFGFPNLTNNNWLYGGTPQAIEQTILYGRQGQMPAWGAMIGSLSVNDVTHYVRSLAGLKTNADSEELRRGKDVYKNICSACHSINGTGNKLLGAPSFVDNVWLYGSSHAQVAYTISKGRNGIMPAWKDILGVERVHIVSAYIYSLNKNK